MFSNPGSTTLTFPSLSARRAWIEISMGGHAQSFGGSLSARRAWIEMVWRLTGYLMMYVALRKESVDRNAVIRPAIDVFLASLSARRAWIEILLLLSPLLRTLSLSARRAWIEIHRLITLLKAFLVALRKESVDRNCEN